MLLSYPDPALMTDAELAAYLREVSEAQGMVRYDWRRHARAEQMEPAYYRIWMLLAGRGFGKTRTGAETVRGWAGTRPGGHYAVIAKTHREVYNVCFTARRAGLLAVIPPKEVRTFNKSEPYLELRNGAIIRGFGAQDPDTLRGYDFDGCWLDEYAAWPLQTAQGVFDMLWFCMREAPDPRMVISTTPKPLPHVKKLLTRAKKQRACSRRPRVVITRGKTLDNADNLSPEALEELLEQYGGTRLGRQELDAELLTDVDGALWKSAWIEAGRIDKDDVPPLVRTVVSVDPADTVSDTSDETGIVAVGRGEDGEHYVLADRSMKIAGMAAARRIWQCYLDVDADVVVYEGSSAWLRDILVDAWVAMQNEGLIGGGDPPLDVVQARASKRVRAEPVAARYEVDPPRVHHAGTFPALEDQLTTWTPESGDSPDRLDALVHGVTYLRSKESRRAVVASPLGKQARPSAWPP
ncbi:terminase large subunit domain-containing protein [Micromonospora endophytica]|uniref:ATP-binding protein n=1 Tax=Micromonospora endophytica TaxID=515350 RepID=A0A2W2DMH9_9ACTN|nr:terminase family protein [Micromonospora endophytica]PZF98336.1 ATP-binding protein [Micromonospora endophytica]RIW43224.1 ATP-binding protein [Micromonospora endophytica]BCJ61551.1 DNA-packaging protein [Micromonospora endophytica]